MRTRAELFCEQRMLRRKHLEMPRGAGRHSWCSSSGTRVERCGTDESGSQAVTCAIRTCFQNGGVVAMTEANLSRVVAEHPSVRFEPFEAQWLNIVTVCLQSVQLVYCSKE